MVKKNEESRTNQIVLFSHLRKVGRFINKELQSEQFCLVILRTRTYKQTYLFKTKKINSEKIKPMRTQARSVSSQTVVSHGGEIDPT